MLSDAITREEKLQNKYSTDIESLIRMNKQLNELVNKKNQNIASIKNSYKNIDIENKEKISKLNRQSSEIFNDYSKYVEMKNIEMKSIEQEKMKYMNENNKRISDLEEQKMKNEYMANYLKEESKLNIMDYRNQLRGLSNIGLREGEDSQRENIN